MPKLTDKQLEALRTMDHRGSLCRWPGGFWTYLSAPVARVSAGHDVPVWYVAVGTLEALRTRGLSEITLRNRFGSPDAYAITPAGRAALAQQGTET